MKIKGILHKKDPEKQITEKLRTRYFVLRFQKEGNVNMEYIPMQLINDKCKMLDDWNEGDVVTVYYDVTGRESKSPRGEINKDFFVYLKAYHVGKDYVAQKAYKQSQQKKKLDKDFELKMKKED